MRALNASFCLMTDIIATKAAPRLRSKTS